MIKYIITGVNKAGVRVNIFADKRDYPTLRGVKKAVIYYSENFHPEASLKYEEVEVETQEEKLIKLLDRAYSIINFYHGVKVGFSESDECESWEKDYNEIKSTLQTDK